MIMNTKSRVEFARLMGLSKGRVTQLVERGMPTMEDGRISFKVPAAGIGRTSWSKDTSGKPAV